PPPPKKQKSQDKRLLDKNATKKLTSSYTDMINCDNSNQESMQDSSNLIQDLALDADNNNITELSNNERLEELDILQKPDKLQGISSEFEAAVWLAKHPHILDLAMIANLKSKAKTLFLQTKNNTPTFYTKLVFAICGISKADKKIPALIKKNTLGNFVHEAIKRIITSKLEKTDMKIALRSCDTITVDLQIPTILGIVTRLSVQDLLKYKTS
ncbi:3306_t:CDS:2, partial [Dentiscutata erythropus]